VAHARSFELTGPYSEMVLRQLTLDTAFIGVDGIDAEWGGTVRDEAEATTNRLMAERAARAVVVADSSKVGVRCFARVGGAEVFGTFVTDTGVEDAAREEFTGQGLEVVTAAVPGPRVGETAEGTNGQRAG
jgi:DeoR/GlpR family transcriptional regulator of sugar metabolism